MHQGTDYQGLGHRSGLGVDTCAHA